MYGQPAGPEPAPLNRAGAVRSFRKRATVVQMARWDGSDEARRLISERSGKPVPADTLRGAISVWVQKSAAWMWLPPGDWAAFESDGTGVYPLAEEVRAATYEPDGAEPAPLNPGVSVPVESAFLRQVLTGCARACRKDADDGDAAAAALYAECRAALAGLGNAGVTP
jgi:hypothetical protein